MMIMHICSTKFKYLGYVAVHYSSFNIKLAK